MATAENLEDYISCSICFEVCREPHALTCLHTFCHPCIRQLEKLFTIECPECRQQTHYKDVKKDFKTQRLIDMHNRQKETSIKRRGMSISADEKNKKCDMCSKAGKPIKYKCIDCDQFMCSDCHITHKSIKLCKNHIVKPVPDILSNLKSHIQKTITMLQREELNAVTQSSKFEPMIKEIQEEEESQLATVDKYLENLIEESTNYCNELKDTITQFNGNVLDNLKSGKNVYDQSIEAINAKSQFLQQIVTSKDITTLKAVVASIDLKMNDEVENIKQKYPKMNKAKSSVFVHTAQSWTIKNGIWISKVRQIKPVEEEKEAIIMYPDVIGRKYQLAEYAQDVCNPYALSKINNEYWCGNVNGFIIYDNYLKIRRRIANPKVLHITRHVCCPTNHLIVACDNNYGLHQLDLQGNYQKKLHNGSFSSVTYFNGTLYALEYVTGVLIIILYHTNTWTLQDSITVYKSGHQLDRVLTTEDKIYISSFSNDRLFIYNHNLDMLSTVGQRGSESPGSFKGLLLCDVDQQGNILLADYSNDRFQLYHNKEGRWYLLKLPHETISPLHLYIEPETMDILVTTHDNKILKFVMTA